MPEPAPISWIACSSRTASSGDEVVQVGDDEVRARPPVGSATGTRSAERLRPRSSRSPSPSCERLPAEHGVAVLGPAGPAAAGLVAALAGGAEEAVLLDREDALLEPDEVRLERRHVGEQERDPLRPAVGDVAQVERRDVQSRVSHRAARAGAGSARRGRGRRSAGASETGIVNANVAPLPSSDSTRITPPWPSTMWRAIARPRPVPPPLVRVRSAL